MATKDQRWALRVDGSADKTVRAAAELAHHNLTDFVVQAALNEADRILGDRTRFTLPEADWVAFNTLLDEPARDLPGLQKLFATPSVFE